MATSAAAPDHAFLCATPTPGRAYHPDGVELTYAQVREPVLRLRDQYAAAGYGHGHRIALLFENRPEFFFHYLAMNALGVGVVPVNPDYRHDELAYLLEHSEADLAVSVPERVAALASVARERARPLPVLDAGAWPAALPRPGAPPRRDAPGPESECAPALHLRHHRPAQGLRAEQLLLPHAGAWYQGLGGRLAIEPGRERFLNPLPLFHMNCQAVTATCAILTASCLILPERFSPRRWWPERGGHPRDDHPLPGRDATSCSCTGRCPRSGRTAWAGLGAGVEPQLHEAFERRFGFPLVEVWGMTETGRIFSDCHEPRAIHTRAFGRAHGGLEARVVDDGDRPVPTDTEGELLVRWGGPEGPRHGFFTGYLKNAEATAEAWRGGWFHTGDVVRQGADGMLYFVDRKKNIIRRSGENIAAAEVEAVLQAHEAVAQVAVLAVPDEIREEEVMACVVPMPGSAAGQALAERLADHCLERLAYFKAPGWVLFVETLPTTGTQKVQKAQIFPRGEDPRARPGALDLRGRKRRG